MDNFGLHDKIEIDHREFHVHTGALIEQRKIISEVFEKGMFLIARAHPINLRGQESSLNYDFLSEVAEKFHQNLMDELESLYSIESKLVRYRHPKSHYYLGVLFLKRNLFPEAINQFKHAIEQDESFMKAFIGLGISYLKSQQYINALETFRKAYNFSEKYPDFLNYYGLTYLFLEDFENATSLFKEAIKINPNYVEAQFNLGVALYKSALEGARDVEAVAVPARVSIYLKQVRDLPKYRIPYWQREFNQLLDMLKENNHSQLLPQLENFQLRLVDLTSDREKIYEFYLRFLFGGNEFDLEQIRKYEAFFHNNEEEHSQYPDFWNNLGTFSLVKSRSLYLKAIAEFEKAIALAPDFEDAKSNLEQIRSHEKGFLILLRAILK